MDIDQAQKERALQKAKELMAEGERQRARVRLSRKVEEFEMGNVNVLLQDEFVRNVSQLIVETAPGGRAEALVEKLGMYAGGEDVKLRERAVMALSFCFGLLNVDEHEELLKKVTFAMAHWLEVETMYLPVCDTVCRQLQQQGLRMLEDGDWQDFGSLLEILFQIQTGALEKGNVVRGLVARTQDGLAIDRVLDELAVVCLQGQGKRQLLAKKILTRLGRRSVVFFLEKLLVSQQKEERLHLLRLIPEAGKIAVPVLKEYLTKDLPWYGIRNIVLLVAVIGDSSLLPLVIPALKHKDIRVQQQVIECINDLAGVDKMRYLLAALSLVDDELKPHLVGQLGQLGCAECTDVLLDLLAERETIAPHVRDELLGQLCIVLRLAPQQRTLILLRQLVAEREQQGVSGHDTVGLIARRTLQVIEPQLLPVGKGGIDEQAKIPIDPDPKIEQPEGVNMHDLEAQIEQLVEGNKIAEVTALIVEHAIRAAKEKDFVMAENLRDRLFAVNSNALVEVIRVGEVIEEEKSSAISSHHLSLWGELYDFLDTEAFSALYHCQQFKEYQAEEVIVEQGTASPTLYFINAGQCALTCRQGEKEIFLKRVNPGEIVGVDPFFDVSVWTVTLTAMTAVKVQILEREAFVKLLPKYPGLESNLAEFCRKTEKVTEILKNAGETRREYARYADEHRIIVSSLLDSRGVPSPQKFKGQIEDISSGGLSLLLRISKKENARLLLGRDIVSFLPVGANEAQERKGKIVGVTLQDFLDKDYVVHVRFLQPMEEAELKEILGQWHK